MPDDCIFCKIANKQITVDLVFENDEFLAFRDLHPQAPVHALLIPKAHFPTIMDISDESMLGRAQSAVQQCARVLGLDKAGFRTVLNCREQGGQTVFHVHWHILGGRAMGWPPG
jgi:histidine triad (HIT) family protein